jgi:hypothetical protein
VSDYHISPLAKRLAEENNVDWRGLRGSGESGKVVEQDVIDYLARVMAGEEGIDPTPEPLPEGMKAWTDQDPDFAGGESSWTGGSGAETGGEGDTLWSDPDDDLLEQESAGAGGSAAAPGDGGDPFDLADDVGWQAGPSPAEQDRQAGTKLSAEQEPAIDEDIFLFDDTPPSAAPAAEQAGDAWQGDGSGGGPGHGADLEGLPGQGLAQSPGEPQDSADDDFFSLAGDDPTDPVAGDGREFSWDEPEFGASAEEEPAGEGPEPAWPAQDAGSVPEEVGSDAPWGEEPEPWNDGAGEAGEELSADSGLESPDGDSWTASTQGAAFETPAATQATWQEESVEASADTPWEEAPLPQGAVLEESETRVTDRGFDAGDTGDYRAATEAQAPVLQPERERTQFPAAVRGVAGGIVLRRDVDLTALMHAQKAVSRELALPELMAPASFLVRAAARAGRPWPLGASGSLPSLATLTDEGVTITLMERAAEMPFRELVAACQAAGVETGAEPSELVVADLSVLGIDEAVLDIGRPVLTLGRVLSLADPERYHGTLALTGPVAPDAGSRFLARVVELLSAPVRLVL